MNFIYQPYASGHTVFITQPSAAVPGQEREKVRESERERERMGGQRVQFCASPSAPSAGSCCRGDDGHW